MRQAAGTWHVADANDRNCCIHPPARVAARRIVAREAFVRTCRSEGSNAKRARIVSRVFDLGAIWRKSVGDRRRLCRGVQTLCNQT